MNKALIRVIAASVLVSTGVSCMTAYDAYGQPRQVVDPGAALLGVAAAGLIGFALADGNGGVRQCHGRQYHGGQWNRGYGRNQCRNNWY